MDELEAQLQSSQADLKSAQKRIEQLHGALKDHEEFSGDEDAQYDSSHMDNMSSDESNFSLGDDDSIDLDIEEQLPRRTNRTLNRNRIVKNGSPLQDDGKSQRRREKSRSKSKDIVDGDDSIDDFEASRKARQERLKKLDDDDDNVGATRKARQGRLKKDDDDDDFEAKRKARQKRLEDLESPRDPPKKETPRKSSIANKQYDDDEDNDDDDLEQFLLKQRERMRNLDRESEEDDVKNTRQGDRNGKANGLNPPSEPSAETAAMVDEEDSSLASRQRRKRQRRRTIEQLKSPFHKTNGVNL